MSSIFRRFADNNQPSSLANSFRRKRFELFRQVIAPLPRPLRILDLGGEENFWHQMGITAADGLEITMVNLTAPPVELPFITSLAGDARALPQYRDQSFELVFSNSVIEHVGDFADQQQMAAEVRRIGKRYFVQTPAKWFPLEPHFLFPFFAVLPQWLRISLVQRLNLGWYRKIPDRAAAAEFLRGFQLLDEPQMRLLFPDAELQKEVCAGLTKSYICIRRG